MAVSVSASMASSGLPTPMGTPQHTPSSHASRQSQYGSSPLPFLSNRTSQDGSASKDTQEEEISPYDPRRFTPNLHASLVAEILSLRRDVENKNALVDNLEDSLHTKETENDQLHKSLNDQTRATKDVRRQMQMLESGTLSALDDMAKERESAVQSLIEARKRLETSKEKVRSQDEDAKRMNNLWDLDRRTWENDKRTIETKLHVAEGRLKTMVNEVASIHSSDARHSQYVLDDDRGMRDTWYTKASDEMSVRTNSVKGRSRFSSGSTVGPPVPEVNHRYSNTDGLQRLGSLKLNGISLADELNFEEGNEDEQPDVVSLDALPEEIQLNNGRMSQQSFTSDHKAFRLLGLLPEGTEPPSKERKSLVDSTHARSEELESERLVEEHIGKDDATSSRVYQDSAIQYSPTQSPTIPSNAIVSLNQDLDGIAFSPTVDSFPLAKATHGTPEMVSIACQTFEERIRTPTPTVIIQPPDEIIPDREMKSTATQTSDGVEQSSGVYSPRKRDESISVPVIAIHPPGSRPNSSHNGVVLPPRTRNAGCQVSLSLPYECRSVSMQTESIKVDRRTVKIPPRLPLTPRLASDSGFQRPLISAASLSTDSIRSQRPIKSSTKSVQRKDSIERTKLRMRSSLDGHSRTIVNDSGFLNRKQSSDLRRPLRSSSLFAGFDDAEAPETPDIDEKEVSSDDDFLNAAPIRKTLSKDRGSWKLVPQIKTPPKSKLLGKGKARVNPESRAKALSAVFETTPDRARSIGEKAAMEHVSKSIGGQPPPKLPINRRPPVSSVDNVSSIRRSRSPSAPDATKAEPATVAPPFPVPTRSSSRKIPISVSEGAQSPSPYTTSFFANTTKAARPPVKSKNPLRKVRSAATVEKPRRIAESRMPQSPSPITKALDSPTVPPTVSSNVSQTSSVPVPAPQPTHPFPAASLGAEVCVDSPTQPISVVDAIAQTMIGEWMWKYVRKRKSFGRPDNSGADVDESGSGGVRHKRWVWLAPYERAIMWSSKQPTSGPALLGKSGRKLTIQSAIDVKDETPMPKGADVQSKFGQSLLILTPERALKFTATSKERHHTWLTALTFLSHSASGMNDLTNIPPVPRQEYQGPPSRSSSRGLHRSSIRDSIRIAKSKSPRPSMTHTFSSPPNELLNSSIPRDSVVSTTATSNNIPDYDDAAEAPHIPRTSSHNRKRSSTGPSANSSRPGVFSSSTSFQSGAAMASTRSLKTPVTTAGIKEHGSFSGAFARGSKSGHGSSSMGMMRRVSENDAPPPPPIPLNPNAMVNGDSNGKSLTQLPAQQQYQGGYGYGVRNNFFDAVGTVRMEAFVSEPRDYGNNHHSSSARNGRRGSEGINAGGGTKMPAKGKGKKDMRYWGLGSSENVAEIGKRKKRRQADVGLGEDPFKGF